MKLTDQQILDCDPFQDDCSDIQCRTAKIVITRKEHNCVGCGGQEDAHIIPPGTRAKFEKAIVEGTWGQYYLCVPCIERHLDWVAEQEK